MRNFTSLSRMLAILFLSTVGSFGLMAQENWEQVGKTNDFSAFPTGFVNPNEFSAQGYGATGSVDDNCAYKKTPAPGDAVGITVSLDTQKSYKAGFKLKANAACTVKLICEGPDGAVDISDIINLPKSKAADPMLLYISNEFKVSVNGSYNLMVVFVTKPNTSDSKLRVDDFELYQKDSSPEDPVLTVSPDFLNFENVDLTGEGRILNINVKGENLTSALNVEVSGEAFSTDITTIGISEAGQTEGYTLPVTFKPTAVQIYYGKITVSGGGITESREIILTGKGFDPTLPPVTVFSENCGNPVDENVDIETHIWQNSGLIYQGVGTVRNSLPSTGYPDASGNGCVLLTASKNGEPWLQISGINTLNYRDLVLSFGTHIMGTTGEYCPLIVEVSPNGINWNKLDSLKWWDPVWEYKILTGEIPACQNLRIRFSRSPEPGITQIRLDDIKLSGYLKDENSPIITGTDLLDFGTVEAGEKIAAKTALIQGTRLKGDLTVSYSGDTVFNFGRLTAITKAEAEAGYQLPISFATNAPGTYTGTITITGEDASPLLIGLKGEVITPTRLPIVFYSEHCGAPYAPASLDKNNWQNLNIKYEGTADVRSTIPSTGYPGASGNGCVFLNAGSPSENQWFQISQLNTSPYTKIVLSFGVQKSSKTVDHSELLIEASADGIDWNPLTIDNILSTDWNYMTAIGKIPACDNLRIRFTNTGGGQFRLDDIKLTGIKTLFTEPTVLITPADISFNKGEIGETLKKEIVIYGYQLTGDLEVTLNGDNAFSIGDISVISPADAENGYVLPVTFNPQNEQSYTGSVIIGGGGLSVPKTVGLSGTGVHLNISTLAELRQRNADETSVYTLRNNDLVVTFRKGFSIYVQDSTAGILVYNSSQMITTFLSEGDIIPEIKGTLKSYNGLLELIPDADVTISGNRSLDDPITVSIAELITHWDQYESRLVRIDNVQFAKGAFSTSNRMLNFTQDGNTMACYDKFSNLSGFVPPTGEVSVIGFPAPDRQLYPRSKNDIFLSPTGITDHAFRDESIYAHAGTIRVKTKAGEKITVFNLVGQKIAETVATGGTDEITLPGNQLVIVKTPNRTVKINL